MMYAVGEYGASKMLTRLASTIINYIHFRTIFMVTVMINILALSGCDKGHFGPPSGESTYGYVRWECTGQNEFIRFNEKLYPIELSELSDKEMISSLRALKSNVLTCNSDGRSIFLVGQYDTQTRLFTLLDFGNFIAVDL